MVRKTEVTEIYQGTCVLICFSTVTCCDWYSLRIGGSVLDVKKWIESGTPVDIMSKLNSLVGSNSSPTNIQKLFAGICLLIIDIDCFCL